MIHNDSPTTAVALLVEGSAVASKLLERVLDTALQPSLPVVTVTTPREAPADLHAVRVALVDIDLDDTASLQLLRALPPDCWRLATTLYEEEERLLPALEAGVHGYLLKQDRYERQVEVLQMVLRGRPELSPALARSVLEAMRQSGAAAQEPLLERTLASLGSGLSVKETARALELTVREVQSMLAHVYNLARKPTGPAPSALLRKENT